MKWFSEMEGDVKVCLFIAVAITVMCICVTVIEIVKHLYPTGIAP